MCRRRRSRFVPRAGRLCLLEAGRRRKPDGARAPDFESGALDAAAMAKKKGRPKPPLGGQKTCRSAFAIRRHLHRRPAVAWFRGRWHWTMVRNRHEVGLFAALGTDLLVDPTLVAGALTGLLRGCHEFSFERQRQLRPMKSSIRRTWDGSGFEPGLSFAFCEYAGRQSSSETVRSYQDRPWLVPVGDLFFWHSQQESARPLYLEGVCRSTAIPSVSAPLTGLDKNAGLASCSTEVFARLRPG